MMLISKLGGMLRSLLPNAPQKTSSETGTRLREDARYRELYRQFYVDPEVREAITGIREMDKLDGRVKMIHSRVARDIIKGGLVMQLAKPDEAVSQAWEDFRRRCQLDRHEKLKSDARGLVMEGNLPLQIIVDDRDNVCGLVRMPSETIVPNVNDGGQFKDVAEAYWQHDLVTGKPKAKFALWQLHLVRFDPDNFDDMGALGRPFLDANRTTWQKLRMTEEDLVIRRRVRAPLRLSHTLEGASAPELESYEAKVINKQGEITTDYFSNKKGSVNPIQGDANLDHVADIALLLDCFFSGSPMPKGLAGYTDGLNRDILEDLKRDYYDEIDVLQDTLAYGYQQAFHIDLLLKGINPLEADFMICYAERRTETPNQAADRALKLQALGMPKNLIWQELGYDPAYINEMLEHQANTVNPYPDDEVTPEPKAPQVKITPGNGRKGQSATSITHR
ncbi:hypothetical protein [Herminiimonas sp. CN]|uniref:hypothetical protein n=1 Tax=Herminiimonas sp. CN TaxID=1349818 RepID=UPI000A914810|nr:hypothetical protein [Herminiimonas sp. CN]